MNLTWEDVIKDKIQEKTTGEDGGFYDVQRNSSKQANKWRKTLTEAQVEAIRKGSLPFKTNLYNLF